MNKSLLKNSFVYTMGDILNKSIPFLMLPIITRYLTPEDYGTISLFVVLVSIFSVFIGLSVHGAINVNFFQMQKSELKVFIGNCLIILHVSTFILLICLYLFKSMIVERLSIGVDWIVLAIVISFAQFLTIINLLLWMVEQRPKQYSIYQISQTFIIALLSIILIVGFGMGWKGQIIANAIGVVVFSAISFLIIIKRGYILFRPNKYHIRAALKFGIPLIPHQLASWIKIGADRMVLLSILGMTAIGIYAVSYQIGMVISVIAAAFNKAWSPYLFKVLSSNPSRENQKKIVLFTYIYFALIFIFALIFTYISELLIPFFLGDQFINSTQYILYFALAFAFEGMYFMMTNYIFYTKKTYILSYITFATSILHLGLLYVFVNINGILGAAQASMVSFAITFFATWALANNVYKMPWRVWKV